MERSTPVRKSHTSTADLLVWTENPQSDPAAFGSAGPGSRPGARPHQPPGGITPALFGGPMTEEEVQQAESEHKRKPCSDYKLREITGSGIFAAENEEAESGNAFSTPNNRTGTRLYQQAASAISHISFSADESVSPRKPVSLAEVAKQRELSGNLESDSDARIKKQPSSAKCKELSGHDIFGPPPEIPPRALSARNLELQGSKIMSEPPPRDTQVHIKASDDPRGPNSIIFGEDSGAKTARKIHNQKFSELSGNDIFKGDAPPGSADKHLSAAKLREMSGNDIFADGKSAARDYLGGVRKPPGGESSIALV